MALITDSEVKTYLQILHTDDDPWITQQVAFAEKAFLNACPLVAFTPAVAVTELLDGGSEALVLKRPVTAITSVKPDRGDGEALLATDYDLDAANGLLYRDDRTCWAAGRREWEVVYDTGFSSVPADAKEAMILMVAKRHARRTSGMRSERIGDWSYSAELRDPEILELMSPYIADPGY